MAIITTLKYSYHDILQIEFNFFNSSFSNYSIATRTIAAPDTGVITTEGASAVESNILTVFGVVALLGIAIFYLASIEIRG